MHHWEAKRPVLPSGSQGSLHLAGAEMGRLAPRRRWPDTRGALGRAVPPSRPGAAECVAPAGSGPAPAPTAACVAAPGPLVG